MVDFPAPKVGAADVPPLALAIRRQDECPLACANQYPYATNPSLLRYEMTARYLSPAT
jgi:hypothetical protein